MSNKETALEVEASTSILHEGSAYKVEPALVNLPYHTRLNKPNRPKFQSKKPTKVQESPLDAKSPQEVLKQNGMYKDESIYKTNPERIYLDLTAFDDYQTNMNNSILAQEKFDALSVDVKARFNHNIAEFTQYITSKDFDIEKLFDDDTLPYFRAYKKQEADKKKYEEYKKTEEYKKAQEEAMLRAEFERQKYNEWLNSTNKK